MFNTCKNRAKVLLHQLYFELLQLLIFKDANGESRIKAGKLNLVDLAGSERQSKTQA
jgi:kinesin family protein 3/17